MCIHHGRVFFQEQNDKMKQKRKHLSFTGINYRQQPPLIIYTLQENKVCVCYDFNIVPRVSNPMVRGITSP